MPLDLSSLDALLDAARAAPPSTPRWTFWEQLCALLETPAFDQAPEQWLDRVGIELDAHWADKDRVCRHEWLRRKRPPAALALTRHLALGAQTEAVHRAIFARIEAMTEDAIAAKTPQALPWTSLEIRRGRSVARRPPVSDLSAASAAVLVRALERSSLRALALEGATPALWDALLASPAAARLERISLQLSQTPDIRVEDELSLATRLLAVPARLRSLRLSWSEAFRRVSYPDELVAAVIAHAPSLESLELETTMRDERHLDALSNTDWPALALLQLDTDNQRWAQWWQKLIARSPRLEAAWHGWRGDRQFEPSATHETDRSDAPSLRALRIRRLDVTGDDIASLLTIREARGLRSLKMYHAPLSPALTEAILSLALEHLQVGDDAYASEESAGLLDALVEGPIRTLRSVYLPCADLDSVCRLSLPALRRLSIHCLRFDEDAFARLRAAPWLAQLESPMTMRIRYALLENTSPELRKELLNRSNDPLLRVVFV